MSITNLNFLITFLHLLAYLTVSVLALRKLNHGCQKYLLCVDRRLNLEMYPGLSKGRAVHEVRSSGHLKLWSRLSLDVCQAVIPS